MCLIGSESRSIISNDGKLIINYCSICIEVIETFSMQIIQSKIFEHTVFLNVEENKKGDFEITCHISKLKYIRSTNEFIDIRTGVLIINNPQTDGYFNITIYKDLNPWLMIDNTRKGFKVLGKRNLYFVRNEHGKYEYKIYRLVFNVNKNRKKMYVSNFSFRIFPITDDIKIDEKCNRLYVRSHDVLYVSDLYTLKLISEINNVFAFNDKYVIVENKSNTTRVNIALTILDVVSGKEIGTLQSWRYVGIILNDHYALLDQYFGCSHMIYNLLDLSKNITIDYSGHSYNRTFKILDDMNKIIIVRDKICTFVTQAGNKRLLALGEHCANSDLGNFINSNLFDSHLLGLITDFLPQRPIVAGETE